VSGEESGTFLCNVAATSHASMIAFDAIGATLHFLLRSQTLCLRLSKFLKIHWEQEKD
jgi:hypothetical protein